MRYHQRQGCCLFPYLTLEGFVISILSGNDDTFVPRASHRASSDRVEVSLARTLHNRGKPRIEPASFGHGLATMPLARVRNETLGLLIQFGHREVPNFQFRVPGLHSLLGQIVPGLPSKTPNAGFSRHLPARGALSRRTPPSPFLIDASRGGSPPRVRGAAKRVSWSGIVSFRAIGSCVDRCRICGLLECELFSSAWLIVTTFKRTTQAQDTSPGIRTVVTVTSVLV